ncbi:MAG: TIR domain-containing protein [Gammaproteobacteria bacterium]|nr:TIR domain-containing protein [Gammaproteobacteria bacterium]
MAHDVFISHSSEDKVVADAVTAAVEQAGFRCWIAPRDIRPGDSWGGSIIDAIGGSRVMVVIFSARSNDSKQVMREVERAVQLDVVVVPFRIEDVQPSRDMEYFLSATHWLDAMSPALDDHLNELVTTIGSILERPESETKTKNKKHKASPAAKAAARASKPSIMPKLIGGLLLLALVAGGGWYLAQPSGPEKAPQTIADKATSATPTTTSASPAATDTAVVVPSSGAVGDRKLELGAPQTVDAASAVTLTMNGDTLEKDYVVIAKRDANDSVTGGYKRIGSAATLDLNAPAVAGDYEVRYYDGETKKVIIRSALKVQVPSVTLAAADQATAGGNLSVEWTAPNYKGDYLTVALAADKPNAYANYSYTRNGSPTELRMPDEAGEYEIRYVPYGGKTVWANRPIKVLQPQTSATLDANQQAGAEVMVKWTGPANKGDFLTVANPDAPGKDYENYAYVRAGKDTKLKMPEIPGDFEVRYISGQKKLIWARSPVSIATPEVSVSAVAQAEAGATVKVDWQGPGNSRDLITVADPGSEAKQYRSYVYARPGTATTMQMPDIPGSYKIRYVSAQKKLLWAEHAITVTPRSETLTHPATVKAGERFEIGWQAAGGKGEWIGVFKPDTDNSKQLTYVYTQGKTRGRLAAPKEPGKYQLRYVSSKEKLTWATSELIVE